MKHLKTFAAMCCAAVVFAACDQKNEPTNDGQNDNPNNPPMENPDTLVTAEYTLTVLSADTALGTVTGSGRYANGTKVAIAALPNDSCVLLSWSDCPSMELDREITLTSDSTITATFRSAYCTLTVLSNDEAMGTVTGSGKYAIGTRVQIEAMPKDGFMFSSWSNGQYDESIIIQLENDSTVTAKFCAETKGYENGHMWVNLGLPSGLKWANIDVGKTKTDYLLYYENSYFHWGETESKSYYATTWWDYKYGTEDNLTKYNATDGKTVLDPEDDVASVNWGGKWRTPTKDEWQELLDNCEWMEEYGYTWQVSMMHLRGYSVKSTINGESIFFPVIDSDEYHDNGMYWSSTLDTDNKQEAYLMFFNGGNDPRIRTHERVEIAAVRPVCE